MKKLFTLILTVGFALSAFALSMPTSDRYRTIRADQSATTEVEEGQVLTSTAPGTTATTLPATLQQSLRQHEPLRSMARKAQGIVPATQHKAPATVKAEIDARVIGVGAEYDTEEAAWYTLFQTRDARYLFYFNIASEDLTSPAGTYTEKDLAGTYSVIIDNETWVSDEMYEGPAEYAIQTMSLKIELTDGALYATGSVVASDGNTYTLTTDYTIPEITNHVTLTATDLLIDDSYLESDGCYIAYAETATTGVFLQLFPEDPATAYGTYGVEDLIFVLMDLETYDELQVVPATAAITLAKVNGSDQLTGTIVDYSGTEYTFALTNEIPEVTETVSITATNLRVDESMSWIGVIYLYAGNEDYKVTVALELENETIYGAYSSVPYCDVTDLSTGEMTVPDIAAGKATIARNTDGTPIFSAEIIDRSGIQYDLHFTIAYPDPVREESLTFTGQDIQVVSNTFLAQGRTAVVSPVLLDGTYDMAYFGVAATYEGSSIVGEYTSEDLIARYTILQFFNSENDYDYRTVQAKVDNLKVVDNPATETYTLTADITTMDSVLYHATIISGYPDTHLAYDAEEGSVDRAYTDADQVSIESADYTEDYGFWAVFFDAESTEYMDALGLGFVVATPDPDITIPAGVYPINLSQEVGTVIANTGVTEQGVPYSYYGTLDEDGFLVDVYLLVGGTVTVEKVGTKGIKMVVDAVNSYDVPVKITYESTPETALHEAQAAGAAEKRLTQEGHLQILRGGHIYDATGAILK